MDKVRERTRVGSDTRTDDDGSFLFCILAFAINLDYKMRRLLSGDTREKAD
jgi:hypothetical protein